MIYRPGGVGRFFSRDDMALRGNEEEMGPVVASRYSRKLTTNEGRSLE